MKMPEAKIYAEGLKYWPYRASLQYVLGYVSKWSPPEATVTDLMCGTGDLLGKLAELRPDLNLAGVDINKEYVEYGNKTYPSVRFVQGDVLDTVVRNSDVVLCTGSLHHVPYEQQEQAIINIAAAMKRDGFAVIADCYIDDYNGEHERRLAAAELGYAYLRATIENGAPADVLGWTADILRNDVCMDEFKTSIKKRLPLFKKHFREVEQDCLWPLPSAKANYGDYAHVCCQPN